MTEQFRLTAWWRGTLDDERAAAVSALLKGRDVAAHEDSRKGETSAHVSLTVEWADAQELAQKLRDAGCVTTIEKIAAPAPPAKRPVELVPLPGTVAPPAKAKKGKQ